MNTEIINGKNPFISKEYIIHAQVPITPDLADWILEHANKNNVRPPSPDASETLTNHIKQGTFLEQNCDLIGFDWNGIMVDGQTRMLGILNSGKTVKINIALGCDPKVAAITDRNRPRTLGHILRSLLPNNGHVDSAWLAKEGSMAWNVMRYQNDWGYIRPTENQLADTITKYQSAFNAVRNGGINRKARNAGVLAACALYIARFPRKGLQFFNLISNGKDGLRYHSGEYHMWHWLDENTYGGGRSASEAYFKRTVRAINAFHKNETFSHFAGATGFEF
jgi:hypothetical protein